MSAENDRASRPPARTGDCLLQAAAPQKKSKPRPRLQGTPQCFSQGVGGWAQTQVRRAHSLDRGPPELQHLGDERPNSLSSSHAGALNRSHVLSKSSPKQCVVERSLWQPSLLRGGRAVRIESTAAAEGVSKAGVGRSRPLGVGVYRAKRRATKKTFRKKIPLLLRLFVLSD